MSRNSMSAKVNLFYNRREDCIMRGCVMGMPFPGMDPYLEHAILWEGFHARLIPVIANQLQPRLDPRYIASIEERVFVEEPQYRIPDIRIEQLSDTSKATLTLTDADVAVVLEASPIELRQKRVEILDAYNELKLVAVIEVISPTNKTAGEGRRSYLEKQQEILDRECHFVEIDMLRKGEPVFPITASGLQGISPFAYLTCVHRWPHRARFELYPRLLRQRLPRIRVPLIAPDPDVTLDLQAAVEQFYEDGRYHWRLKYHEPCRPALSDADQAWDDDQLRRWREQLPGNGQPAS